MEVMVTTGTLTPKNKAGPRVDIGGRVLARRDGDGAIGVQFLRGDGGFPEEYTVNVGVLWIGVEHNTPVEIGFSAIDHFLEDFDARSYAMKVIAEGGAFLRVEEIFLATAPYATPGTI